MAEAVVAMEEEESPKIAKEPLSEEYYYYDSDNDIMFRKFSEGS